MNYYLLDLERTIGTGIPTYWKQDRRGYTNDLDFAGLFPKKTAESIVNSDIDKWTVMISQYQVERVLE